jgi:pimeloyl-ACP methyl ester carboxylesterase
MAKFEVTAQMLRDLNTLVYDDGNLAIGKRLTVQQTAGRKRTLVVLDAVLNDITSPGLEAYAVIPESEAWWLAHFHRKPRHLLLAVRGSGDDFVNDWLTADLGELTGMSKPLQSVGLIRFVKYMLALYAGKRTQVSLTGHSLGGALVQKVISVYPEAFAQVVTFAAANGWNLLTAEEREAAETQKLVNYYHVNDVVHQLPPFLPKMVGRQVGLDYSIASANPAALKLPANAPQKVVQTVAYHDLSLIPFDANGAVDLAQAAK